MNLGIRQESNFKIKLALLVNEPEPKERLVLEVKLGVAEKEVRPGWQRLVGAVEVQLAQVKWV